MPWLVAVALVHSTRHRTARIARDWTILLAIMGFGGAARDVSRPLWACPSVHAFAVDPRRGIAVLILLRLALGAGFGLLQPWRAPRTYAAVGFAAVSRACVTWNNFGLAVAAGVGAHHFDLSHAGRGGVRRRPRISVSAFFQRHRRCRCWRCCSCCCRWNDVDARRRHARSVCQACAGNRALRWRRLLLPCVPRGARCAMLGVWLIAGGLIYLWTRACSWGQ